jgi:hypothetical protein
MDQFTIDSHFEGTITGRHEPYTGNIMSVRLEQGLCQAKGWLQISALVAVLDFDLYAAAYHRVPPDEFQSK